jgi:phycocyanobilin lyase beta subunit
VRYSAVAGLETLAAAVSNYPAWYDRIQTQFQILAAEDSSWAVRARATQAQRPATIAPVPQEETAPEINWESILQNLYARKGEERSTMAEGDPRKYRGLAYAIEPENP